MEKGGLLRFLLYRFVTKIHVCCCVFELFFNLIFLAMRLAHLHHQPPLGHHSTSLAQPIQNSLILALLLLQRAGGWTSGTQAGFCPLRYFPSISSPFTCIFFHLKSSQQQAKDKIKATGFISLFKAATDRSIDACMHIGNGF